MAQLRSLGFEDSDAQDAVAITIAEGGQPRLEAALDWLCVHVPEPNLPARFAAGNVQPAGPAPPPIAPSAKKAHRLFFVTLCSVACRP